MTNLRNFSKHFSAKNYLEIEFSKNAQLFAFSKWRTNKTCRKRIENSIELINTQP